MQDDPNAARKRGLLPSVKLPQGAGQQKTHRIRPERDRERSRHIFINDKPNPKQNECNATPSQKIELQKGGLLEESLAGGVEHGTMLASRKPRVNATECCRRRIQRVFYPIRRMVLVERVQETRIRPYEASHPARHLPPASPADDDTWCLRYLRPQAL
jgi:hypothetical protein